MTIAGRHYSSTPFFRPVLCLVQSEGKPASVLLVYSRARPALDVVLYLRSIYCLMAIAHHSSGMLADGPDPGPAWRTLPSCPKDGSLKFMPMLAARKSLGIPEVSIVHPRFSS